MKKLIFIHLNNQNSLHFFVFGILFYFQQKVFLGLWEEKPYNNIEIRNNDYQTSSMGTSQL